MNDYNCCDKSPPKPPVARAEPERDFDISIARNHLKHPERVSIKVLLWAREVVAQYERERKVN